jgi:SPP1 gp7 family putative phage head morphogenesis protein
MVRVYGDSWGRLSERLAVLTRRIEAAQARGEAVTSAWLFQRGRLEELLRQTEAEVNRFARFADQAVTDQQAGAVTAAQAHAHDLVSSTLSGPAEARASILGSFTTLPREAVQDLVGFSQDGSPLRVLFDGMGTDAGQTMQRELIAGLVQGENPRKIARQVRDAMGAPLDRALVISRTETLRSYREASRRNYEENEDVVEGWIWFSAQDATTCACCWAMHGQFFPNSEHLDGHMNCRCTMLPQTRSWQDLGFNLPDTRPQVRPGPAAFAELPDRQKRDILGPGRYDLYNRGVGLDEFVGRRDNGDWGTMRYVKPIKDIVQP